MKNGVFAANFGNDVVKDFGAKGDGTTDDTAAIQAAINAALSVSGKPLALFVPSGNYKLSASLLFYDQSGVSFYGAGAAATQFTPTTALAGLPVFLIRNVRNSSFSGFTINPVASGAGPIGIQIDRAALAAIAEAVAPAPAAASYGDVSIRPIPPKSSLFPERAQLPAVNEPAPPQAFIPPSS